ncbi:kinase-like domain-containing protein [Gigaspora rosea]|uniref:Kinase-like domain-containing protein n=1 Tax=Gigaspora rosea TaxID=44941 RepID=A0A397U5K0_9GLOM|nr:kinase-like domain-containing protein [Gigaspora rosea]
MVQRMRGDQIIDDTIKKIQKKSSLPIDFVEWIPYEQLEKGENIGCGGFGDIYSAFWKQGPISMHGNEFKRTRGVKVALKRLMDNDIEKYKSELCMHINCCTNLNIYTTRTQFRTSRSPILRCYGLTKDDEGYMLVMQLAKYGNLESFLLSENFNQMKWLDNKLPILANIANGLRIIHKEGLIHCDLHCGNILIGNYNMAYITDFGLSKFHDRENSELQVRGRVQFIAPEVFKNGNFSFKSDIYSFGIIMWMFSSGILPFHNSQYSNQLSLSLDICGGTRPQITEGTPPCYVKLMQRCWDPEPEKRPSSSEIYDIVCSWYYLKNYKEFKAADKAQNIQKIQIRSSILPHNTNIEFSDNTWSGFPDNTSLESPDKQNCIENSTNSNSTTSQFRDSTQSELVIE